MKLEEAVRQCLQNRSYIAVRPMRAPIFVTRRGAIYQQCRGPDGPARFTSGDVLATDWQLQQVAPRADQAADQAS